MPDDYSTNFETCLNFQELEKSKFATQALDLSKLQEETRQQEQMVKIKEYEAHIEQLKIDQKRVDGEQRRKNMEEEGKQAKYKAEYQVIDIIK